MATFPPTGKELSANFQVATASPATYPIPIIMIRAVGRPFMMDLRIPNHRTANWLRRLTLRLMTRPGRRWEPERASLQYNIK